MLLSMSWFAAGYRNALMFVMMLMPFCLFASLLLCCLAGHALNMSLFCTLLLPVLATFLSALKYRVAWRLDASSPATLLVCLLIVVQQWPFGTY